MTNYEMIKKIAKNVSIETVKELLEKATEEIRAEEESYKKMIPRKLVYTSDRAF